MCRIERTSQFKRDYNGEFLSPFPPGPASQTGDCGTLCAERFMLPIYIPPHRSKSASPFFGDVKGGAMFRRVVGAFRAPRRPRSSRSTEKSRRAIARGVVRRTATGNVRLQLGQFVTKDDLNRQYERIKNFRFSGD